MDRYQFSKTELEVIEHAPVPLAIYQFIDNRVVTIALSKGLCKFFGYEDMDQAYYDLDHNMYKYAHPDDAARVANAAYRFATEGGEFNEVWRTKSKDNSEYRIIHAIGEHVFTDDDVRLAYVWYADEGAFAEANAWRESEFGEALHNAVIDDKNLTASNYDYFTGLISRAYFLELAETARKSIINEGGLPVFLYMDLCGMKFFNTRYGYAEGDKLLKAFANFLSETFNCENCSYFGADHFVALTRQEGLEELLKRFFKECETINGANSLPVRIGIYPDKLESVPASTACDRAKIACDSLANTYASGFTYYKKETLDFAELRQYILSNFEKALEDGWIQVYFQPIIRTVNGKVSDDEALSRWEDPERGLITPTEFIPVLEEAGLVYKLDLFVLDKVLEKIKLQQDAGLFIVPQSINLSRADFEACDIVEEIRKRVDEAGVSRNLITIEVTESAVTNDFDFMKDRVTVFHDLGLPVWIDDFGSGYSSLNVLQSIRFDLIKFDMNFMRSLDDGDGDGRIMLTELVRMASVLGIDTLCEGVETEEQVRFLQEIGCSKLQGFFYSKPIPLKDLMEWHKSADDFGYENPEEAEYYEHVGRVNLYDLDVVVTEDVDEHEDARAFNNFFNTLPMGIIEVKGNTTRFARSNQSYRDFVKRFLNYDLSYEGSAFVEYDTSFMRNIVQTCCIRGVRSFYDEKMPDGSTVHSFARRVGINPVNGTIAVAVVVLSITSADEGASYAEIVRALAADYYRIYYVNLETEDFIEYSSEIGKEELATERHGKNFFDAARNDIMARTFEEDRESLLERFTKENILKLLDKQGAYTGTYRLLDAGEPINIRMKATRMQPDGKHIIFGVSIVDS